MPKSNKTVTSNALNINSVISVDDESEYEDSDDPLTASNTNSGHHDLNNSRTSLIQRHSKISLGTKLSQSKSFNFFLYTTDILLSVLVFSPLIGLFWYCTWSFLDDYFLNDRMYLSNFLSLSIGLIFILAGYLMQELMQLWYDKLKQFKYSKFLRFLMRTVYAYIMSMAVILQWRAVWNIYNFYLFKDISSQLTLAVISIAYFCITRSTRSLVCNPYLLYVDESEDFFVSESRHKITALKARYLQYLFDFFIVEIVECIIMNFLWFGVQNYLDQNLYPKDVVSSLWASFSISHIICLIILLIQNLIFNYCSKCYLVPRLIMEDMLNILMVISTILAWKFYWDLIDHWFYFKSTAFYLYLGGHIGGFILAVICNVTGSLVGPGTGFLDGENKETKSYFEVNFLTGIFKSYFGIKNEPKEEEEEEEEEPVSEVTINEDILTNNENISNEK